MFLESSVFGALLYIIVETTKRSLRENTRSVISYKKTCTFDQKSFAVYILYKYESFHKRHVGSRLEVTMFICLVSVYCKYDIAFVYRNQLDI